MSNNFLIQKAAAEFWAMERMNLEATIETARDFDLTNAPNDMAALAQENGADELDADLYETINGVAIVPIHGTILKTVPALWKMFGCNATGCDDIKIALAKALNDPAVEKIMLHVDSPGGTVAGVQEAGDVIFAVRQEKPVHAYIEDLAASAGYWLACQASSISANVTAHVGSIGVYTVYVDSSRAYQSAGLDAHLIASGPHKGAGQEGVKISPEQLAQIQENVDDLAFIFKAAVCRGRSVSIDQAEAWATGRTWIANRALDMGLVDKIENQDEMFVRLTS